MYLEMINTRQDNKSGFILLFEDNKYYDGYKNKSFIALCKYMHLPALN